MVVTGGASAEERSSCFAQTFLIWWEGSKGSVNEWNGKERSPLRNETGEAYWSVMNETMAFVPDVDTKNC
jgi:hypothetical protein